MKKTLTTIALIYGFSTGLSAQKYKSMHEITIGYGGGTTSELLNTLSDVLSTGLTAGTTSVNRAYTGAFHASYKYSLCERISVGPTFVYEYSKADACVNGTRAGGFKNNYYTFAAEGKIKYLSKPEFSLYGLMGAGATIYDQKYTANDGSTDNKSKAHFNFQFTPIGMQVGRNFGAFVEAGFGYKGIVCGGFYAQF